jgi:hypothetical protein
MRVCVCVCVCVRVCVRGCVPQTLLRDSVVVSAEGRVCTFGNGMFGCLGLNDEQDRLVPALLAAEVFEGSTIVTVSTRTCVGVYLEPSCSGQGR